MKLFRFKERNLPRKPGRFLSLKSFIKQLGYLVTTRDDFRKGEEEMQQVNSALRQHHSLVIYPEGTFTRARGV